MYYFSKRLLNMSTPPPNKEEAEKDNDNVSSGTRGHKSKDSSKKRKSPPADDNAGGGNDEGVGGNTSSTLNVSAGLTTDKKLARMQREAAFRNLERANADLTKANANLVNEVAALKERVSKAERIRKKYPLHNRVTTLTRVEPTSTIPMPLASSSVEGSGAIGRVGMDEVPGPTVQYWVSGTIGERSTFMSTLSSVRH